MWPCRPRRAVVVVATLAVVTSGVGLGTALHPSAGTSLTTTAAVAANDESVRAPGAVVSTPAVRTAAQERPDPPTVVRVNLTSDGDARWRIVTRIALEDRTDRAAFRAFVADLRDGETPAPRVGYSPETFRRFADRVAADTGRSDMEVVDPRWNGTVRDDTGELWLSFTWTNFARTDGDRVLLDDVFRTDLGWFTSLPENQRLVIAPPPGYAVTESPFPIEGTGTIRIDGPDDVPDGLTAENVSVVYEPTAVTSTSTTDPPTGEGVNVGLLGGLVAVVLVVLGAAYLVRRDPDFGPDPDHDGSPAADSGPDTGGSSGAGTETAADAADGPTAGEVGGSAPAPDGEPTPATGEEGDGATADGAHAEATDDGPTADADADARTESEPDADDAAPVDETLLSDEERVERLLADNGGRMKQARIVSETGWSNAKVSQLLSSMDDADRVDKLRIGRENLISLPEESVVDTPDSEE